MNTSPHNLAGLALDAGGVKFDFEKGFPFVSGIQAPIYIDTRRVFFEPAIRERAIQGLASRIEQEKLSFDIVAGVESGAIAPAALLASVLGKQFVYVKKKPKEHGLKRMIECGDVAGHRVLLIEDMVSTGGSSLNGVQALKDAGASIDTCMTIHFYDFPGSRENFLQSGITLHSLILVAEVAHEAASRNIITKEQEDRIISWLKKPHEHW
ncbi:MAG: orotate phosphoribosyltransferase [Patescibacteria group bacterium]